MSTPNASRKASPPPFLSTACIEFQTTPNQSSGQFRFWRGGALALFPSFHYYYIYSAVTFVSLRIHIWLSFPNYTKFDPFRLLYSGECES